MAHNKQEQGKGKVKGAAIEQDSKVTKKTLGTTWAGRPSKLAVVYEEKVLEEMNLSDEMIEPTEILFAKNHKQQQGKRRASTPKNQKRLHFDTSVDMSPVRTPRKSPNTSAKSPKATKSPAKSAGKYNIFYTILKVNQFSGNSLHFDSPF